MGYYSVWLFVDGVWTYIVIDDNFPYSMLKKKPYFCDKVGVN